MRVIPAPLAAHLATGATTLATCWTVRRADGAKLGFTDHDRDLTVDGVVCRARTGFEGTQVQAELGLAVTGGEVAGALSSEGLTEADLEAGLYDAAAVETWLVNWTDPGQVLLLGRSTVGEVRRQDSAFSAELRSAAHRLDQVQGRRFGRGCDADLGDGRCRVDLAAAGLHAEAVVLAGDGRLTVTAALSMPAGRCAGGRLLFTGGANAGRSVEVKRHTAADGIAALALWRPMAEPIQPGDPFTVTAGCDKSLATCRDVFGNVANHRGFPHIPGNDQVLGYASSSADNDGASLQ